MKGVICDLTLCQLLESGRVYEGSRIQIARKYFSPRTIIIGEPKAVGQAGGGDPVAVIRHGADYVLFGRNLEDINLRNAVGAIESLNARIAAL